MTIDFRALANSYVRDLTPYQPGKPLEELEREYGINSSIKLASNENPLGASEQAILAAKHALSKTYFYPDGSCYALKKALSQFLKIPSNWMTIGNGSENILELAVKTYLTQHDTAVISQYAFLTIPIILQSHGVLIKIAPAKQFGHDMQAMINAIDKKTRVLFLVNPNNPTGTYTNQNEFHQLMESVPPHILVVVDEAYGEYINAPDYPDTLSYLARYPNLMITRTFSKAYGLAGLRLGYAISSPEIADMLNRARLPFNVNTIASTAAIAALEDQEHVKKANHINQNGMQYFQKAFDHLKLKYIPSVGNFITLNVGDAVFMYQQLLREGIIVRPLHAYHMPEFIRVTIGTEEQNERFLLTLNKLINHKETV